MVWGFSLGTGVAVALAAEHPVCKLILEAPYTSMADVAGVAASVRAGALVDAGSVSFRPAYRAASRLPLLVMHGERDPAIPIGFGERLFALAHEPKQFVRFPEGGHDDLDDYGAIETARQFIDAPKG